MSDPNNLLGSGTFGEITTEINDNGEEVARKYFKYGLNQDAIREINCAKLFQDIPELISLNNIIMKVGKYVYFHKTIDEYFDAYVAADMEKMDTNLVTDGNYPLTFQQKISIMFQVTKGIATLHSNGYMHRDIKPQNILIKKDGDNVIARVCDFGTARPDCNSTSILTGGPGTEYYRAPETENIKEGQHFPKYGTSSDVWSLGITFLELILGMRFDCNEILRGNARDKFLLSICLNAVGATTEQRDRLLHLLDSMTKTDPDERITAQSILEHPFFNEIEGYNDITQKVYMDYPKTNQVSGLLMNKEAQEFWTKTSCKMDMIRLGIPSIHRAKQLVERYYAITNKINEHIIYACFYLSACIHTDGMIVLKLIRLELLKTNQQGDEERYREKVIELHHTCIDIMEKCDYIIAPYQTQYEYLLNSEIEEVRKKAMYLVATLGTDEFTCEELVGIIKRCSNPDGDHTEVDKMILTNYFDNYVDKLDMTKIYISILAENMADTISNKNNKRKKNKCKPPCVIM